LVDGRQKLLNIECPICHGVLEDEYKHTLFADLHRMGCFKCGYTIIFEDQINVPAKIHKYRIDMLPDMIRNMHTQEQRVKE
jgi:ribosomal protein S27AE